MHTVNRFNANFGPVHGGSGGKDQFVTLDVLHSALTQTQPHCSADLQGLDLVQMKAVLGGPQVP